MKYHPCRECGHRVKKLAFKCSACKARYPANKLEEGWGYQYKSKRTVLGIPLLHISIGYRPNGVPVPAKGIVAIGQFGIGVINISQFGVGLIGIGQFTLAGLALSQIAVASSLIAQVGLYFDQGFGQKVMSIAQLFS